MYQAYPGGPQQIYYVPVAGAAHSGVGLLENVRSKIRDLAATDKLEGFSLSQTFSETFKKRGPDELEEYMMVGSSKTTPPIETVETGWPKPWMFFRQLGLFAIAFAVLYGVFKFTGNEPLVPAIMFMGAFAVPISVLVFLFEMNTPRNVSLLLVGKLFVMGGLAAICAVSFEYMSPMAGKLPGIVEETAKLAAVILVVRSARYKYELNGILFGAAVGAGFASFETTLVRDAIVSTFVDSGLGAAGAAGAGGIQQCDGCDGGRACDTRGAGAVWPYAVDGDCGGRILARETGQADELFDADGSEFPEDACDSRPDAYALGCVGSLPESSVDCEYPAMDRDGTDDLVCAVRLDPAGPAPGAGCAEGAIAEHFGTRGSDAWSWCGEDSGSGGVTTGNEGTRERGKREQKSVAEVCSTI